MILDDGALLLVTLVMFWSKIWPYLIGTLDCPDGNSLRRLPGTGLRRGVARQLPADARTGPLLQTEDYTRAVISQNAYGTHAPPVESLAKVRMERQNSRLGGEHPAKLWAILDEAAPRRTVGSADVMRDQLQALTEASELPNATVQLLPISLGAHPGLYGPFVILTFPAPTPALVWLENPKNSVYLEADDDVDNYTEICDQLRACALGPSETRAHIAQISEELTR
ncbi:DUF5753 domain-containing protein [Streptomyces sp. NPDC087263]|uniref:DUF5753 domain-containing protein n=1 Tax=Streptomyces sp. NPDC087263 TaxID=3365773 RepID=UPI003804E927